MRDWDYLFHYWSMRLVPDDQKSRKLLLTLKSLRRRPAAAPPAPATDAGGAAWRRPASRGFGRRFLALN